MVAPQILNLLVKVRVLMRQPFGRPHFCGLFLFACTNKTNNKLEEAFAESTL